MSETPRRGTSSDSLSTPATKSCVRANGLTPDACRGFWTTVDPVDFRIEFLLRYYSEPATLDGEAKILLERGMALAMEWATHGLVVPHISRIIDSTIEAIMLDCSR